MDAEAWVRWGTEAVSVQGRKGGSVTELILGDSGSQVHSARVQLDRLPALATCVVHVATVCPYSTVLVSPLLTFTTKERRST